MSIDSHTLTTIGKIVGMALGGIMPAYSIGRIGTSALNAIGRNPDAAEKVFMPMILGMALAEAIAIYTLVLALK